MKVKDFTIKINRFGPLRDVELKMSPLTILTGESSLGKSYANYLFYYFIQTFTGWGKERRILPHLRNLKDDKANLVIPKTDIETWLKEGAEPYMQWFLGDTTLVCDVDFELSWLPEEIVVEYEFYSVDDSAKDAGLNVKYSDNLRTTYNKQIKEDITGYPKDFITWRCFQSSLKKDFAGEDFHAPRILPPGRCSLVGQNFSVQIVTSSMGMYDDFIRQLEMGTRRSLSKRKPNETDKIVSEILGGTLSSRDGEQYLELKSGERVSLRAAASSIKEISPLIFHYLNLSGQHLSFCFDEPEAHLHPAMQSKVADFVAAYFNKGNLFQITTHSDYFLSRINQLIKLRAIMNKDKAKAQALCERLNIPLISLLEKEDIGAYYFERGNDGVISARQLEVTNHGIPFATFFDTITQDRENDRVINEAFFELNCDE